MRLVIGNVDDALRLISDASSRDFLCHHVTQWDRSTPSAQFFHYAALSLDGEERRKSLAFHFARDSLLYVMAHVLLRRELSLVCPAVRPEEWRFRHTKYGKPYLIDYNLWFSLSHSWPYFAVLISQKGHCGVDIERAHASFPYDAVARQSLHAHEYSHMRRGTNPYLRFLRFWTIKEAACKAFGCGIPLGFPLLHVSHDFRKAYFRKRELGISISMANKNMPYAVSACCLTMSDCICSTRIAHLENFIPHTEPKGKAFASYCQYYSVA
jgi:4'-phosphopantetheinyl transferase